MATFPDKIQRIIEEGYEFRFGDYISQGFSLVQRNLGGFIGFALLYFAIQMGGALIPIIGSLALFVISPALTIGPYHVSHKLDRDQPVEFADFFRGFDKLGNLFVTSLLTTLMIVAALIPGIVLMMAFGISAFVGGRFDADANWGLFLVAILIIMLPIIYLGISYMWAPMFVWFYDLDAWSAMEASRRIIGKNWWLIFGFAIVCGLIAMLGVIMLLIGLLFTIPAIMCASYAAFADVTRLNEEEDQEADVIDHFIPMAP